MSKDITKKVNKYLTTERRNKIKSNIEVGLTSHDSEVKSYASKVGKMFTEPKLILTVTTNGEENSKTVDVPTAKIKKAVALSIIVLASLIPEAEYKIEIGG